MSDLIKIQFCCGSNLLPGWHNHDADMDIAKSLRFEDDCASHVFCEHGIEHLTHQQGWNFLDECHRILATGGRIRIAIPDFELIWSVVVQDRGNAYIKAASPEGTMQGALKAVVFNHGHKSVWTGIMLYIMLQCVGFQQVKFQSYGASGDPAMCGIDGHGKVVGEEIARIETTVVEGVKL